MSARRRLARRTLAVAAVLAALPASAATASPAIDGVPSQSPSAYDHPRLDGSDAFHPSGFGRSDAAARSAEEAAGFPPSGFGRSDAAARTADEPAPYPPSGFGRSDAAWRTADEPATPTTALRTVSDDGTDLVPVLPGAIVLVVALGGAGLTVARMNRRHVGLSH